MIDIRSRKCITCNKKHPTFNYPDEEKPLFCSSCKLENMVDVKNKKCVTCKLKQPSFNYPNENQYIVLFVNQMIRFVSHKNIVSHVTYTTSFQLSEWKQQIYCNDCKKCGMIDVANKRCISCILTQATGTYNNHCAFCFVNLSPNDPS